MSAFSASEISLYAGITALLLPLLAFAVIMLITRPYPKLSAGVSIGAAAISLGVAIWLLP